MAYSPIYSKPAKQPNKNWMNSTAGSCHGFAENVPRRRQPMINGDELLSKRSTTVRPVKPLELNLNDDEEEQIDPHRNISDLANLEDVETDEPRNLVQVQNIPKMSRTRQRELAELQQMMDEKEEPHSQTSFTIPLANRSHAQSHSHTHPNRNKLQKIFHVKCIPCDEIFFNREKFNHHMARHDEDLDNIDSRDLIALQNNMRTSRTTHVEEATQQEKDDDDNEKCHSQTSFPFRRIAPKTDVILTAAVSRSRSVGSNNCSVGGPSGIFFHCKICFRPFNSKKHAQYHSHTHCNREELQKTNIFHGKCEPCNKIFFHRRQFNDHTSMHRGRKKYSCTSCKKKFTQKGSLTSHLILHLDPEEKSRLKEGWKYECFFCRNRYKTIAMLHTHLAVHTKEKPFQCPKCRSQFTRKEHLTNHEKIVHLRQKKFSCPQCNRKFAMKCNMKKHLNGVHLGIRHKCSHCDKDFSEKGSLRNHEKRAHQKAIHV